jgi:peptide/nickel transport system substrate-binding protein
VDAGPSAVDADRPDSAPNSNTPGRSPGVRAYVFADVRGYTRYTDEYGADAAATLVARLAEQSVAVMRGTSGALRGMWGDQVLLVFASAKEAASAALELQRRVASDEAVPSFPIGVGIDVGEAAGDPEREASPALNVAARLCARSRPGEVLATREVVHLAGPLPGVAYINRGTARLKGIAHRTAVYQIATDEQAGSELALQRHAKRVVTSRPWLPWAALLTAVAVIVGLLAWTRPWQAPPGPLTTAALAVIDRASGDLRESVDVGATSGAIALGPDSVWVTGSQTDTLTRLTRSTKATTTIPVDAGPIAAAASGNDVWVAAAGASKVTRVNTLTNKASDHIQVAAEPRGVAVAFGRVWVSSQLEDAVTVLDATTGRRVATVGVGAGPVGVAAGLDRVWVANTRENTVSAIDPQSLTIDGTYAVGSGPTTLAIAAGSVWVVNSLGQSVTRIDPTRAKDAVTIRVGDSPTAIAADDARVWVGNLADGTVSEIDPARDLVVRTLAIGASPTGLAVDASTSEASTAPFAAPRHRGGTLTVGASVDSVDPQVSLSTGALELVYDRLLGLQRTGGPGYGLAANLAQALPQASDDATTWQVPLRPGVQYSDGRPVQPGDFKRGIERALSIPDGPYRDYYTGIVGAAACHGDGRPCHLDSGITTTVRSITFHLAAPDADFPYKLTLMPAAPVPADVAMTKEQSTIPGTGPYVITRFTPPGDTADVDASLLILDRNPRFTPRSALVKQAGYADHVRFLTPPPNLDETSMTTLGIDVVDARGYPALRALASQYPDRYRTVSVAGTHHLVLDTHTPPFSDRRARQAFAFAVDRRSLAEEFLGGAVTCHLSPPGYPGSAEPCRFTDDSDGSPTWHAPDLDHARQLVRESGTTGATVTVVLDDLPTERVLGDRLAQTLTRLGYRPQIRYEDPDKQYPRLNDPAVNMQVGWSGWGVDFPSWSQFFDGDLRCTDADPEHPPQVGLGNRHYCNAAIDRLAEAARSMETKDRHRAWQQWSAYFDAAEQDAALIPFDVWTREYFVSDRVGNLQVNTFWAMQGLFYEQLWVK